MFFFFFCVQTGELEGEGKKTHQKKKKQKVIDEHTAKITELPIGKSTLVKKIKNKKSLSPRARLTVKKNTQMVFGNFFFSQIAPPSLSPPNFICATPLRFPLKKIYNGASNFFSSIFSPLKKK